MGHYSDTGTGPALVLLHGIGMSHFAWSPVIPYLCSSRRVIAFDVPGFGLTPPLPKGTVPSVPHLVDGLEASMREIGIKLPVDIAGNSLGGCMALEAARRGIARSVIAISPAGLWKKHPAFHVKLIFGAMRFMATSFSGVSKAAVRVPALREAVLAAPISIGGSRMPVDDAVRVLDDLARSPAFEDTFHNTSSPFSGRDIVVPVTVAFGDRDWILTKRSQRRNELPAHTQWLQVRGWGHVPTWLDPTGVSRLILESTK